MQRGRRQGTFSFLGFQFYIGKSRKENLVPKLQTDPKRLRKKLQSIKEWCASVLHRRKLREVWPIFQLKLQGHINYFGVSFNMPRLSTFVFRSVQIVFKQVNRRSQNKSYNWAQFNMFLQQFGVPKPSITHPLW